MKWTPKYNIFSLASLILLTSLFIFITNRYILTINFYENSGDPLSGIPGQKEAVYQNLQKWIYVSSAIYLVIKMLIISIVIYTGIYLSDIQIAFPKIFFVVTLSEFIFFIPAAIKILWFHYYYPGGSLTDWHRFYVLSAIELFPSAAADYSYALQTANVFEVAYWFLLAFGISKITRLNYDSSLKIVIFYYLPALFIWTAVIIFFSLMMFPETA